MNKILLLVLVSAISSVGHAFIPDGKYISCTGEHKTINVFHASEIGTYILAVESQNRLATISTDLVYKRTLKSYVGHVTNAELSKDGYTLNGPVTVKQDELIVQDPYTGSASVVLKNLKCSVKELAGF